VLDVVVREGVMLMRCQKEELTFIVSVDASHVPLEVFGPHKALPAIRHFAQVYPRLVGCPVLEEVE
jgi:hypothetical protein